MRDDGAPEDYPVPAIDRFSRWRRPDWLAVSVAVLSMVTTLGSWAWWGGALNQRVDQLAEAGREQETRIRELTKENAAQDRAMARTGAQYEDIIRRLDAIDRKLDRSER